MSLRRSTGLRKLLLYSHDTYGLGHLRRNLAIATHMLATTPGLRVVLLSGSSVSDYFTLPPGLSVVHLPPVTKHGHEQYRPLYGALPLSVVRRNRASIMSEVVRSFTPDVFLVDHAPAGMSGELLDVFGTLRTHSPRTRVLLGLRDVLDEPGVVRDTWREQGIYQLLDQVYDEILVYGSQEIFDIGAEYAVPTPVADRLRYCGYLTRPETCGARTPPPAEGPYLLGTAGGGGDGAEVLAATLGASEQLAIPAVIVTGPLMATADQERLTEHATRVPGAQVVQFLPSMRDAMSAATAVVTMGGYNSLCEVTSTGVPTVVVPRTHPRREQDIRAALFAQRGLVHVARPGPDLGPRVAEAVTVATSAQDTARQPLDMSGLQQLREVLVAQVAAGQREERASSARRRSVRVSA